MCFSPQKEPSLMLTPLSVVAKIIPLSDSWTSTDFIQLIQHPFTIIKSFLMSLLSQSGDRKSVTELTAFLFVCLSSGFCHFLSSGRIKPSLISVQKNMSIWEKLRNKTPFEFRCFEALFTSTFHTSAGKVSEQQSVHACIPDVRPHP